jgi:hypothetical protein
MWWGCAALMGFWGSGEAHGWHAGFGQAVLGGEQQDAFVWSAGLAGRSACDT